MTPNAPSRIKHTRKRLPAVALVSLLLLCAFAYWPGLRGPFVFDDAPNLIDPLNAWLKGDIDWREIVLGNGSGLLGRPLSMLSFLVNAAASESLATLPFKATNLAIHLLCGVLLYALLARLLPRDPWLRQRAQLMALLVAGLWLLHPMQVSTVLYVVQRMAQLSALFTLAGLLAYVHGRQCLESGRRHAGWLMLFLAVPVCMLAAMLSKENGALLPLLCAVIELGYFRPGPHSSRPKPVKWFFALSLLLPGIAVIAWYGLYPQKLLAGYEGRLFTLGERLMSQPRVLLEYMGALVLPRGPALGVYTDDFIVSRGLLNPPATLWAIAGLSLLAIAAWLSRARWPAVFTGIGLFLAGHAMESTVFPLEMYFEHRNYLPSAGFFLAVVGVTAWLLGRLLPKTDAPQRIRRWVGWGSVALLLMLATATWARAGIWSSLELLAEQGVRQHPRSVRAHVDHSRLLQAQGRNEEVQQIIDNMSRLDDPMARNVAAINNVAHQCITRGATTPAAVAGISAIAGEKLQLAEMLMLENLVRLLQERTCDNLDKAKLASIMVGIVDTAPQPPTLVQLWRSRFFAAKLYASSGNIEQAQQQLALAWDTGAADPAVGAFLAQVLIAQGDLVGAERILDEVAAKVAGWDRRGHAKILELRQGIAAKQDVGGGG